MNKVVYSSRGGNTKKVAEAISQSIGGKAINLENFTITEPINILFVGASIYAGVVDKTVKTFIENLTSDKVNAIVVFGTSAGKKSAQLQIKQMLKDSNINVLTEEFHCKGSFLLVHRNKPDESDLNNAKKFAKEVVEKYNE